MSPSHKDGCNRPSGTWLDPVDVELVRSGPKQLPILLWGSLIIVIV